ncbi:MAG: hypothetical protein L3J06_10660 [Cyclobacteriaceae bacterium]|nr:hypothetical protein [Cyclobacteriaceae bacterium]
MESKEKIRQKLAEALLNNKNSLLWSYDLSDKNIRISDKMIIQKYLEFGNKQEWAMLKKGYPLSDIKEVWIKNIIGFGANQPLQKKIVKCFFDASEPSNYLKNERKNQFEKSIAWSF